SSAFAGLAGVLLAPLFAQLAAPNFTILLIAAIAAAAFGRLTSIPLAFLGGILLGVAQGILGGYLPADSVLSNGLRPSLPFVVLSITVITGMAGQISLCQASFAAVGSFGTAQLAQRFDMPVLLTMVIGAAMAAIVGALLAIPALRLGGIFLALATLAFALMFESIFVPLDWVSGGVLPTKVPRPPLFERDRAFLFLALVLLVAIA